MKFKRMYGESNIDIMLRILKSCHKCKKVFYSTK